MATQSTDSSSRGPGRPRAEQALDARQALLDAARELFAREGFDRVSTKRLADEAGVNPAMIHYYFGDKAGLQDTAFREGLEPIIQVLTGLSERSAEPSSLTEFFKVYMRTLAANPWLPRMIVRDVLPDGGRLRPIFVQTFGSQVGPIIMGLVAASRARGELRADLDPLLTTLSVGSLAVFPFVAAPIVKQVLGIELHEQFADRLSQHTVDLFYHGAGTRNE